MAGKKEKSEDNRLVGNFGDMKFEYDGGPSNFTAEIADKEMDAVLDDIMDEALGKPKE